MNKKTISSASGDIISKLKVLAKEKESVRRKLAVTAKKKESVRGKLVVAAKKKESVRSNLAVTARQLALIAKEKESIRRKLEVTAEKLAATAKEKEETRNKLAMTAKQLATTAEEKEDTRIRLVITAKELSVVAEEKKNLLGKLAITAKQLAVIAKEKEGVRSRLAVTAERLRFKAEKLATIAKEKENIKRRLAIAAETLRFQAEKLATIAKEKEVTRSKLAITAKQLAVIAKEKESIKRKLEVTAKNLATLAKEKESVRRKLAITAKQLAVTAEERENTRSKLAVTARQLAVIAEENETAKSGTAIFAKKIAVTAEEKEVTRIKLAMIAEQLATTAVEKEHARIAASNVFADLSEEKKKTELLAKDLEKFKLAVDNASDHITITDSKGIIVYENASVVSGYKPEEVLGKTPGLWGGQMPKEFYAKMWDVLAKQKKPFAGDVVNKRKDGTLYEAALNISPILNKDGEVIFYVGVERDITKAKAIDRSKSEFVSLASHQLRTPLSAINWYAEMLLDGDAGKLNKKQQDYTSEIYASSKRMSNLVGALLNVSRIELGTFAIEPKQINVSEIADSILKELKPKIDSKNVVIARGYSAEMPAINADPNLLRMILQNIISNSVKYTAPGGKITISVSKNDKNILLSVADTGYGIPANQQEHIFQKFFRADNIIPIETDGTGLGLYITKEVLEKTGGSIHFESEENKGTTFTVTIPLSGMKKNEGTTTLS
ncbi:MAG: ATP-binding protein [Candidatus Liptonbacteria bacterium]|nr:ATP-binding protein [Candidatus Liptonbacteria bacterium]